MPRKKESYESLIEKVEHIIGNMEKGEMSLEDSIKSYEDGISACNKLYKILNEAEGKVKILTDQGEKEFVEVDD